MQIKDVMTRNVLLVSPGGMEPRVAGEAIASITRHGGSHSQTTH